MEPKLSRRDFLKLSSLALGTLAARSLPRPWPPEENPLAQRMVGRVTVSEVYVYSEPSIRSQRIRRIRRDELVGMDEVFISPQGPAHNPRWYHLRRGGYIYSAYIQRVENQHLNQPLSWVAEGGRLGEISVPFSDSYRKTLRSGWQRLYRLYYGSVHWITHLIEGPDGEPWYGLTDELLHVLYCVPASHVRPISPEELTPISPDVPSEEKQLQVSVADQLLTAYENGQVVFQTLVSTGIPSKEPTPNGIPTHTPNGRFRVSVKVPSKHMGDGNLTGDPEAYELLGVPWVSFFHSTGVAFHGTYWHDNFGRMMSHGCVNMRNEDALWLYRWSQPIAGSMDWNTKGAGTVVVVR